MLVVLLPITGCGGGCGSTRSLPFVLHLNGGEPRGHGFFKGLGHQLPIRSKLWQQIHQSSRGNLYVCATTHARKRKKQICCGSLWKVACICVGEVSWRAFRFLVNDATTPPTFTETWERIRVVCSTGLTMKCPLRSHSCNGLQVIYIRREANKTNRRTKNTFINM